MNMNSFRLTLRNSFKNAFQSVSQLFGLIVLITILSLIVSLITAIYSGVINNFETLVAQSNLRTLVVDMNTDTRVKTGSDPSAGGDIPNNNIEAQQTYLYKLNRQYLVENPDWSFSWSRTEERNFSGLSNGEYDLKVKTIAKTTPNSSRDLVDAIVIGSGHNIQSTHQTVIDSTFAKKNDIHIGDIVRYQADNYGTQLKVFNSELADAKTLSLIRQIRNLDNPDDIYNQQFSTFSWFQVVGFGESVDFVNPTMSAQTPMANKKTELIAYVDPQLFGLITRDDDLGFTYFDESRMVLAVSSSADRDGYYSLRLRGDRKGYSSGLDLNKISQTFNNDLNSIMDRTSGSRLVYGVNDESYKYYTRVWSIITVIKIYNIIAVSLLIIVLGVVLFTIGLVTKKQVEKSRSQIGLMKALGYNKRTMILNYSVLPFITSVIGSVIGFGIAQALQIPIINDLFGAYFNLDFPVWTFDPIGFILVILVTWLVITGIAFLIAWLIMRDSALELINGNKTPKMSRFAMSLKKINNNGSINAKLRTALLTNSLGKMSAVSLVVLIGTILMTSGFAAPKLSEDNQKMSYNGIKYNQLVEYGSPVYNNPYSFMQTYDPTNLQNSYQFAPGLNKFTGLPIVKTGVDDQGNDVYGYDMTEITNQLLSQKISSEYYGLEVSSQSEIPQALEVLFANQKMLNARGVAINNHFFKFVTDLSQVDPWGWNILNNQWPEYITLIGRIADEQQKYEANPTPEAYSQLLVNDFYLMQSFYRTYMASVGLSIGRDYYYKMSDEAYQAYITHNYSKQISFFNQNPEGRRAAFRSYKNEEKDNESVFGKALTDLSMTNNVFISDGTKKLAINSIYRGDDNLLDEDKYLSYNPETILENEGVEALSGYLSDYLFWYGSFISQQSGTALLQAAYSRPPYFVQQLFKEAFVANNRKKTYNLTFGVIPFNPVIEQLGLKLDAHSPNNPRLNFKIYGIQNNKKFIELRDTKKTDLVSQLYRSDEINPIVINESLAYKLKLKPGDHVDFDILYKELQADQKPFTIKDWKPNETRLANNNQDEFISRNDLDTFKTTLNKNDGSGEEYKVSAGSMNLDNSPSEYYRAALGGEITNENLTKRTSFKVIGVHEGYGSMQAWMKDDDVAKILNYQEAQEYLWTNFFAQQFANEFSKPMYRNLDLYLPMDLRKLSYSSFLDFYVNDEESTYNVSALKINQLFKNAYPIFNYKFSIGNDVADLKSGLATFQEYGEYSPLSMNGGMSKGVNYDGAGAAAISNLIPIKISQDVLAQLSDVIQAVLIMLIVVLIVITFVIILLTTSLIINDNIRFISTMKVLGYTNQNISWLILGMYGIVILITFAIGYVAGWFIFAALVGKISASTSFVLPLTYPIWLVFAVALWIFGIYGINFALGLRNVSKQNATQILQNQEI